MRVPGPTLLRRAARQALRRAWFSGVPRLAPRIVRRLDHDREAFTQGLVMRGGRLFESTGRPDRSQVRELDPATGRLLRAVAVPEVWAEGVALHGDRLVQLTWKHRAAYIYDAASLARTGEFAYEGEGWGLDACGDGFVMTDGTHRLTFRDAAFRVTGIVGVRLKGWPVRHLNDVVFAGDRLYANVWQAGYILEIDPRRGAVTGCIDCAALIREAAPADPEHVLNGIAFDEASGCFLVAGKCWPVMFAVQFEPA